MHIKINAYYCPMIITKLSETKSLPELITIFIALNFIIQLSYKIGLFGNYGFWIVTLFNPIEIMLGSVELLIIYILIFSYIIKEDSLLDNLFGIISITIAPYISQLIYTGKFLIPSYAIFGIFIGLTGYCLKKFAINTKSELPLLIIIFMISPLIFGLFSSSRLDINDLPKLELETKNQVETRYIIGNFSDNFITINNNKSNIQIVKTEDAGKILIK